MTGRAWAILGVLLTVSALAGCSRALDENPHLLAPKLLVSRVPATSEIEIYVHSAVGERQYDQLTLRVDNGTVQARNGTYGIIHRIPVGKAYLTVEATSGDNRYILDALLVPAPTGANLEVVTFQAGKEVDRRTVDLPWDKLLEKVDTQ